MDRKLQAKQLLESELLQELIDELRKDCIERWESGKDPGARENAHAAITQVEALRESVDARCKAILAGDGDGDRARE
jgi:hypothetical protein